MIKGVSQDQIHIKHLDHPNIMTFVNGKKIVIKDHHAVVDREIAKAMMSGPNGYELIGIYDDFNEYVRNIETSITAYGNFDDNEHVLIATPLAGQKIYSWDEYSDSLIKLDNVENTSLVITIDDPEARWKDVIESWAKRHSNKFKTIALIYWNSDKEMAWNRVFKITVARQIIFNYARHLNRFSHIWFIDSDNIHKPDALNRLLSHNRTHTAGIYNFKNVIAGGPVLFNAVGKKKWPPNSLGDQQLEIDKEKDTMEVDWSGAGSLLLSKEIFLNHSFNWSRWIQRHGEDAYICLLAQEITGKQLLVDLNVNPYHLDESGKKW